MTENGMKVLEFIKEIRRFSEELTSLLKTTESLMNRDGWITATGNTIYGSSSYSLQDAKRWYPFDLFRFYQNSKYPLILAFVSIILEEDEDKWIKWMDESPKTPIIEPLVTAGYFIFQNKEDITLKNEKRITQQQWREFENYWNETLYKDLTIDAFSKILEKGINIPEAIETEKNPNEELANKKIADAFYEIVKSMKPKNPFRAFKCFGYPLMSVTNATIVESKIVKPLLDSLPK